ncbi:MAG: hypothetical protein K8R67_05025 [Desulfobacteraceae bacterium]|nr:hypothetical protein [Desulfobacteraceae bacterium]
MIVWFRRPVLLLVIVLTISLSYAQADAFIPESSDIIKLSVEKIVEPVGLRVVQKRKIYNEQTEQIKTEQIKTEPSFIEIAEKLWFSYPGKFRSEAIAGSHDMICAESKGQFVKVIDEFIESKEKSLTDLYTDILLCRQPESLTKKLIASGVDVTLSSFKRHDDKIYFVVGVPPDENRLSSSLWVEKNSDFPGRYTIKKDGLFLDIFYKDWQRVSKTWYPMKIIIFLDGALFSEIDVEKFELEADFEKNLFNVKRLMNIFPESSNYSNESGSLRNESDELEKSITDFKKLYE